MKFLIPVSLVVLTFTFSFDIAKAQIETVEENFAESKAILQEIQKENFYKKGAFDIRVGLLQVSANKSEDPLKLNSRNEMPFFEIAYDQQILKRWGFVGSFLHAQNAMASGTLNGPSASQQMYQLGVQYKIVLDETLIKNYLTLKVQYYGMSNNFKLVDPQNFYIKSESGILLGIERSIPATELFDIRGSFDFIYISSVETESILDIKPHGNGLQLRADLFYNLSKVQRVGLGYGISAFFNKYVDANFEGRDRHTQTYKSLYLDYSLLF